MMIESLIIEVDAAGQAYLGNADWPRLIHIAADFVDLIRRGATTATIRLDGDAVVITVQNGSATYGLVGPCEDEHPVCALEYALEQSRLMVDD